jgi:enoyl-CoA hydratase
MNTYETVLVEDAPQGKSGVRLITLNRPDRRNALSPQLMTELLAALDEADVDAGVRCVVITGAGDKAFCAGGDLGGAAGDGFADMHFSRRAFADLLRTFRSMRTPTVAAINGLALGGGFGLALSTDLAVAADDAPLGTPEVKRGLFPMMIARLIYEVLPRRAANELVFLGERVSGARAVELGIVNKVVPKAEVLGAALDYADRLANLSSAVLSLGRRAVYQQMDMPFDSALAHLHDALTLNLQTEDAAEGITAFFEKREPEWKGR